MYMCMYMYCTTLIKMKHSIVLVTHSFMLCTCSYMYMLKHIIVVSSAHAVPHLPGECHAVAGCVWVGGEEDGEQESVCHHYGHPQGTTSQHTL